MTTNPYKLPEVKAKTCKGKHEPGTALDHGFWKAGERRYVCSKCGHACYHNGTPVKA